VAHASEDANKSDARVPPGSLFFWVAIFANWGDVPEETCVAFGHVFRMESVKEVELEFVFGSWWYC